MTTAGRASAILGPADIGPLFSDRLRLSWNAMSPFAAALDAYVLSAGTDEDAPRDIGTRELEPGVAAILARPDVRVTHRYAGAATAPGAFTACCCRSAGERTVVVVPLPGGEYKIEPFETHGAYVAWWSSVLSSRVDRTGPNYLPSPVPLSTLLYAFHAVDAYRRAKYRSDMSYEPAPRLSIGLGEFATSMGAALASRSPRWLLPAMLLLTPGLDAFPIQLSADDIRALVAHAFIQRGRDPGVGDPMLSFGEAGERMGEEFRQGWDLAAGLEVAVWTSRGARALYRAFLAPTALANHLVQIEPARDGVVATHRVLTQRQLFATQVGLLSAALNPAAPDRAMRLADLRPAAPRVATDRSHASRSRARGAGTKTKRRKSQAAVAPSGAPPQGRGPKVSVREWFRMLWPSMRTEWSPVSRAHVETLARVLRIVREQRLVSESEFSRLHAALRCRAFDRSLWTVGLGSLTWRRWDGGEWVAGEPPEIVCIDTSLARTFTRALETNAPRARGGILDPFKGGKHDPRTRAARLRPVAEVLTERERSSQRTRASAKRRSGSDKSARPAASSVRRCRNVVCGAAVPAGVKVCPRCGERMD
jgi:hypothetical protein